MGRFRLFLSILARDNPVDGGGSCRVLKATTMDEARTEAQAIIEEYAPKGSCDFVCDFAAIAEVVNYEELERLK